MSLLGSNPTYEFRAWIARDIRLATGDTAPSLVAARVEAVVVATPAGGSHDDVKEPCIAGDCSNAPWLYYGDLR